MHHSPHNERGNAAVETALLIALIAVAGFLALQAVGVETRTAWETVPPAFADHGTTTTIEDRPIEVVGGGGSVDDSDSLVCEGFEECYPDAVVPPSIPADG